jgi:hypothetical protein
VPGGDGNDEAAQARADDAGRSPNAAEEALEPGTLFDGEEVADDGEDDGLDGPSPEALDGPEQDELDHGLGQAAEHGAGKEEDDAEHEDRLAADHVGKSAVEGHGSC